MSNEIHNSKPEGSVRTIRNNVMVLFKNSFEVGKCLSHWGFLPLVIYLGMKAKDVGSPPITILR
ncbi:hypothetical protein A3Q56_05245 [Intoshia linei]|uniref:Uncharacterized protein n=1 Tax=Intoshia linei TaxID=1819745 RepID=A0A177AYF8_9BILA|nr:hypothetical protein A3Q56_05245 [Intoshia linei]